jgi:hypothetical protein
MPKAVKNNNQPDNDAKGLDGGWREDQLSKKQRTTNMITTGERLTYFGVMK